jgi:hypothetical protein
MKKRIVLLSTLAAMLAAAMALSGVAQAAPTIDTKADAKCLAEAAKTVQQPGFNPADYTFHGGADDPSQLGDDFNGQGTLLGKDVFCGFRGTDGMETLEAGDIFLGGADFDGVVHNNGTFYGQAGGDNVGVNHETGTYYAGEGDDHVQINNGTYYGQEGSDSVDLNNETGTFDGGDGTDTVGFNDGGTLINVP